MELTNKRITYSISETIDSFELNGSLNTTDENAIKEINLSIKKDNDQVGNIFYSKNDGKITKNYSGMTTECSQVADTMLTTVIANVETELAK